jgi:hypothetical protein
MLTLLPNSEGKSCNEMGGDASYVARCATWKYTTGNFGVDQAMMSKKT